MPAIYTGYETDIVYTVSALEHRARLKVNPVGTPDIGEDLTALMLHNRASGTMNFNDLITAIAELMQPLYSGAVDIQRAELWRRTEDGSGRDYLSQVGINLEGTGASPNLASQIIFTFRTQGGHIAKFYLMETNVTSNQILREPFPAGALADLASYLAAPDSAIYAGDETYVWATLGIACGQNEKLFRSRFR